MSSLLALAHTDTPLRALSIHDSGRTYRLRLKMESHNPTGSIKYRTAMSLLAALDDVAPLDQARVIESTSGNLGIAIAHAVTRLGGEFTAVVDPKLPPSWEKLLLAAGARIVMVHEPDIHDGYLLTRLSKVAELCRRDPGLRWTDQYASPANPAVHQTVTAPELIRQTNGRIDALLAAVSTGGTLAGIGAGLRLAAPATRLVAVDVQGSFVTSDSAHPHLLTGIGATRKSAFLRSRDYHDTARVTDLVAIAYCRMMVEDSGIYLGGSGGAVLAAFVEEVPVDVRRARCAVAVIADDGRRYADTIYDDSWLSARGVLDSVRGVEARARANGLYFELDEADEVV